MEYWIGGKWVNDQTAVVVVDNLASQSSSYALSAKQGNILSGLIGSMGVASGTSFPSNPQEGQLFVKITSA